MAKPAPTPAPAAAEGEAPKKKSKLLLIIIIAVVFLAAAGAGAFFFLKKNHAEAEGEADGGHKEPAKTVKKAKAEPGKLPTYVNLDNFVQDLVPENANQSSNCQIGISLELDDPKAADAIKAFMPKIKDRIIMVIASKKASDLGSPAGKNELKEQIKEEVNSVVGTPGGVDKRGKKREAEGPVTDVLYTSFIVQ